MLQFAWLRSLPLNYLALSDEYWKCLPIGVSTLRSHMNCFRPLEDLQGDFASFKEKKKVFERPLSGF
jgi:hypothetical protein